MLHRCTDAAFTNVHAAHSHSVRATAATMTGDESGGVGGEAAGAGVREVTDGFCSAAAIALAAVSAAVDAAVAAAAA